MDGRDERRWVIRESAGPRSFFQRSGNGPIEITHAQDPRCAAAVSRRPVQAPDCSGPGIGATAAGACLRRSREAGISWPLSDDLGDDALERRCIGACGRDQGLAVTAGLAGGPSRVAPQGRELRERNPAVASMLLDLTAKCAAMREAIKGDQENPVAPERIRHREQQISEWLADVECAIRELAESKTVRQRFSFRLSRCAKLQLAGEIAHLRAFRLMQAARLLACCRVQQLLPAVRFRVKLAEKTAP